jgi:endoglucanase
MIERLSTLFAMVVCILVLPVVALAQFPSPTYGWNLGDTMEPPDGEGTWNNPPANQALVNAVADAGFNTIRIPVAWNSHADPETHVIDPAWLARVQEVVDWSLDAGLTVVINSHWDEGWFDWKVTDTVDPTINAKVNSYWTQIANTFSGASYDERLLFACANEPDTPTAAEVSTLMTYYQTFVDAVRGVGGSNTSRWLVVQGPWTNIDKTVELMNTLPNDPTPDRLAVEVHYYDPWQFTGETGFSADYFWGEAFHSSTMPNRNVTWGEEDWMLGQLQKMHDKFVSEGIPVLLGEFGARKRTGENYPNLTGADLDLHLASRVYYHQLFVDMCNSLGIAPFYWDNQYVDDGNAIFDRNTGAVIDQDMIDALTGVLAPTGDYNGDGVVDAADYTVWRDTLGQSVAIHGDGADGDLSGTIDEGDYIFWKAHFGQTSGSGTLAAAVPEPSSWLLAAMALVGLVQTARRRPAS